MAIDVRNTDDANDISLAFRHFSAPTFVWVKLFPVKRNVQNCSVIISGLQRAAAKTIKSNSLQTWSVGHATAALLPIVNGAL